MSTTIQESMSHMGREIDRLRRRLAIQQTLLAGLLTCGLAMLCMGAASRDGHFDRVFANSIVIPNASGGAAAQLYALDGAGALLIRDSSGAEAVQIGSGKERNDLLIYDREHGCIAVAVQGMSDGGRLSLHRTFASVDAAEQALGKKARDYLGSPDGKRVTVAVQRLPETDR